MFACKKAGLKDKNHKKHPENDHLKTFREKGCDSCPRLSKKYKQEWAFFLDHRNRMKYNELCKKCEKECKQSFRAIIIDCPFERKNRKKKKGGEN